MNEVTEHKLQVNKMVEEFEAVLSEKIGRPVAISYRIRIKHFNPNPNLIISNVCRIMNVNYTDVQGTKRTRNIKVARQIICWFGRNYLNFKDQYTAILINRERSNVVHSVQVVNAMLEFEDPLYLSPIKEVEKLLQNLTTA